MVSGAQKIGDRKTLMLFRRIFYTAAMLVSVVQISSGAYGFIVAPFSDADFVPLRPPTFHFTVPQQVQVDVAFAMEFLFGLFLLSALLENHTTAIYCYMVAMLSWVAVYLMIGLHHTLDSAGYAMEWLIKHTIILIIVTVHYFVQRFNETNEEITKPPTELNMI